MRPDEHANVLLADLPSGPAGGAPAPAPVDSRAGRRVAWELSAVLGALAAAFAARRIDAATPQVLPAIQAFGSSFVPTGAGLALLALWSGHRRIAAAAAFLAALQLATLAPWWVVGDRAVAADRGDLMVMASNLRYGEADPGAVLAAVRRRGVDVLALSEVTPAARDALVAAGLTDALPHVVDRARAGAGGGMLLSRHPLRVDGFPAVPGAAFATPAAPVDTPGGEALVVAAHPVPPWPGFTGRWHAELAALAAWATSVDAAVPIVIAGDLNATAAHPVLRRFGAAGLRDAHRELGRGPVVTWPRATRLRFGVPPVLHLDHILSRGFGVADAGTVTIPGSDHDAVWASLAR